MNIFKTSIPLQMAIATLLGICFGIFFGELCSVFDPWANAYIMILKITTIPYLIAAIIHGVGQLSSFQAKEILKKGIVFIAIAWAINITIIYLTAFIFPKSKGVQYPSYASGQHTSINFAELLIPENIFYDLTNNIVPSIVIFSLLLGIALIHLKEKQSVMSMFETLVQSLTRVTTWIARITPIGTFIIISNQVGTIQFSTIKQVSTYIILYIFSVSIVTFWIFPRLTGMLTPIHASKWLKDLLPILILAYTTNVVIVCLPFIMQLIQKTTDQLYPRDEKVQNQTQGIVSVLFNLPLGSLFIALFVLFASVFYNLPLNLSSQFELILTTFLTGLGSIGLGAWINSLTFLLDSLGLPLDALNVYLTTVPFTAGFQTMVSVMEISTLSLLITFTCRGYLSIKWGKIVKNGLSIVIPVFILFAVMKLFSPLPKIENRSKSIYDLSLPSPVILLSSQEKGSSPLLGKGEDSFDQILKTKTLRVGYYPHIPPFCFYNKKGQVVGYDIAFAYELACDLGCQLALVPLNYGKLAEELDEGLYDIAMSAVSVNRQRLKTLAFAHPYMEAKLVFLVKEGFSKDFSDLKKLKQNPDLKIGVLKGSAFEVLAKEFFPDHSLALLDNYPSFIENSEVDAVLWEEQEAISWTLLHPHFKVVFPTPPLGVDTLGYPIKANSERLLNYLNQWLNLKENEGFTTAQYNLWILRKPEPLESTEPRWSILHNVLHWTSR